MKIVKDRISLVELEKIAKRQFGSLVKAVIDINKMIMAVGGELHADEEAILISQGSSQKYLWGINLYPNMHPNNWIEFDSIINLRPSSGNKSRGVDNPKIKEKILIIVNKLVTK